MADPDTQASSDVLKAFIVTIDWPHAEERLFMAYAQDADRAEALAHEKLIELEDLEEDEDLDGAETTIRALEVEGAPVPQNEALIWVV